MEDEYWISDETLAEMKRIANRPEFIGDELAPIIGSIDVRRAINREYFRRTIARIQAEAA